MSTVVWQDPPNNAAGGSGAKGETRLKLSAMQENPGRWLLWAEAVTPSGVATIKRYPGFEAVTRSHRIIDNRRICDIYVRFVGEAS